MTHIFNELDHRLSVVTRWSVVQTIRKQSVAEHSYNVALIALRIAENWFQITSQKLQLAILKRAIFHDWWESVTGDPPTYMKRFIDEESAFKEFANYLSEGVDQDIDYDIVKYIVKIADYIDSTVFLYMEMSLGNKSVEHHLRMAEKRLKEFTEQNSFTPVDTDLSVYDLYLRDVVGGMFNGDGQFMSELHGFPKK